MRSRFIVLWVVALLAATALILAPTPPAARASENGVVISAVYNNGGSSGATYTHRYYELFNSGATSVSLNGWSLQKASGTGTNWSPMVALNNVTLAPGQYYLISGTSNNTNGSSYVVDNADQTSTIDSASAGSKIALFSSTTLYTGSSDPTLSPNFVDFIGYGTANMAEGSAAPAGSITTMLVRKQGGCQDTDNNASDFEVVTAHVPRFMASTPAPCSDIVISINSSYPSGAAPFELITYGIEIKNAGTVTANNIDATITINGGATNAYPVTGYTNPDVMPYCQPTDANTITCEDINLLPNGIYSLGFDVTPEDVGTIYVSAVATADAPERTGNNTASYETTVSAPLPDVTVDTTYLPATVTADDTLTLTYDIANGPFVNANDVSLDVTLAGVATFASITEPVFGCTIDTPTTLSCDNLGAITTSGSLQVIVTADLSGHGSVTSTATVASSDPLEVNTNNVDIEVISVGAGCSSPSQYIYDYQEGGVNGSTRNVTVSFLGVVTADYQEARPSANDGFYMQDPVGDGNPLTSDGILVYSDATNVNVGDLVLATGTIVEYNGLTELSPVTSIVICDTGYTITPVTITLPIANIADYENYEGMLVTLTDADGKLVVADQYNMGFGEMIVSTDVLYQPTHQYAPGSPEFAAAFDLNERSRLVIDDGAGGNPNPVPHYYGNNSTHIRMGDEVAPVTGVMSYAIFSGVGSYRMNFTQPLSFTPVNLRPTDAPVVGGRLKIASFNVLNYFNGDGAGSGFTGTSQRGAGNAAEFARQTTKLVVAIDKLSPDILGVMEIENDGVGGENTALNDLIVALNAASDDEYAYINTGQIPGDVIRVALIYKVSAVTPSGVYHLDTDSVNNRPTLLQTFTENATGADVTVVVNHFKSKGCSEATGSNLDQGDGQACWNPTRVAQAERLVEWIPTVTDDTDIILLGDFNSYAQEDPITVLKTDGFINLVEDRVGVSGTSYYFSGQAGYLDYALASASIDSQITGVATWNINSPEPTLRDYNDFVNQAPYFEANEFRTSDHDPVLIGVSLTGTTGVISSAETVVAGSNVTVTVTDADLSGASITITASTLAGENETLTLTQVSAGVYSGTFTVEPVTPTASNTTLEAINGSITFTYVDAFDADGDLNTSLTDTTLVVGTTGSITSTPESIAPGDSVTVAVLDADVSSTTITITAVVAGGDSETLTLNQTGSGTYSATFTVVDLAPTTGNGTLEVTSGTITFSYVDALNANGDIDTTVTDTTVVALANTPSNFELIAPVSSAILRDGSAVTLTWQQATNDSTYDVLLFKISNNTRLGNELSVTVNAADVCAAGLCSINSTPLTQGTYGWTVIANGTATVEASNGFGLFIVDLDGIELVNNGSFESGISGWTKAGTASKVKVKCGALGANGSDCAAVLKLGGSLKQNGVIAGIAANTVTVAGDVIRITAQISSNKATVKNVVIVKLNYVGGGESKFKLTATGVTNTFAEYSAQFETLGTISKGNVVLKYNATAGKATVDDVSVLLTPLGTAPRSEGSADLVLPPPAAPEGFRGNN